MKINIIKTITTSFLISAIMVPAFAFAQVPTAEGQGIGGATASPSPTPIAEGQNTGGASIGGAVSSVPIAAGQNTGGATSGVPATAGQNTGGASTGGAVSSVPIAAGQNTGGATASPSPTPTPTPATAGQNTGGATSGVPATAGQNTGGASTASSPATSPVSTGGGSGGSSVSGGGGFVGSGGGSLPLLVNISQCNYLTSYLHIGWPNPIDQVTRLQTFLKNNEGLDVNVTGIFDQKTFDAVSVFQTKYTPDVLTPWGLKSFTGYVYYTTRKKINEIYCKTSFALTPAQIAEIEAYRTSIQNGTIYTSSEVGFGGSTYGNTLGKNPTSTNSTNLANSSTTTDNSQVGAVVKASIWSKIWSTIWNFIKNIFGR